MPKKLNKIIEELFVEQQIDKLKDTKQDIETVLGKEFFNKHIEKMFFKKDKIIIHTTTIEAKTELNIIKKNFNTKIKLL